MKIGNYRAVAGISAFGLVLGSWVAFAATADVTEAKPVALSICVQPEAGGAADALSKVSAAAGALPDSHAQGTQQGRARGSAYRDDGSAAPGCHAGLPPWVR